MHDIVVGAYSNIQDFVMLHVGFRHGTRIGAYCSITHHATLHGCVIEDHCLIGINATVMDGCVIGEGSIVAGHTIVSENTIIPANSVVAGVPGKVIATRDNLAANRQNALFYYRNALNYARGQHLMADLAAATADLSGHAEPDPSQNVSSAGGENATSPSPHLRGEVKQSS